MSALAVMFIAMGIADVCRRLFRAVWLSLASAVSSSSLAHCWPDCGISAISRCW